MWEKLRYDRCYIIAEIGGNFRTFKEAKALIDQAVFAGVDCVKLQTFKAKTITSKNAYFDMESTGRISQYEYFKKYEISESLHTKIRDYILGSGLDWFSTPSHEDDVDMLERLDTPAYKLGADDANNLPLIHYIAQKMKPIVLSTGMCTLQEVREAVDTILSTGNREIAILHTISGYPTYPEDVNLNIIDTYKKEFPELFVGFSDHTLSTAACVAAATLGAHIIERHFTLDKRAEGPDHMISSTPHEMKLIVDTIRLVETMKGSCLKLPYGSEVKNRQNNRKSVVTLKKVAKGEVLTEQNIGIRRPGTGIAPKYFERIRGRKALREIEEDTILSWSDF